MDFVLVGIGGLFGSIARFKIGSLISERVKTNLPVATFLINVSGAFLLGILGGINADKNLYLLFADGFLGAYTTFSTFMFEGFNLFKDRKIFNALIYIVGSLVIGICGYELGLQLEKIIN